MKTVSEKWAGVCMAGTSDHDDCFARYAARCPDLASYHFAATNDLSAVEIAPATDESANGIWTLAEIRASGEDWQTVDAVADLMKRAIERKKAAHG